MKKTLLTIFVTLTLLVSFPISVLGICDEDVLLNTMTLPDGDTITIFPNPIELNKTICGYDTTPTFTYADIGDTVRFNISVTYHDTDGPGIGEKIKYITVRDELPDGLDYAGNSTLEGVLSDDGRNVTWDLQYVVLYDGDSYFIEFDAVCTEIGLQKNMVNVTALEKCYSKIRYQEAYAYVNVNSEIDFVSRDVDDDGNLEKATDVNKNTTDGFEVFSDDDNSSEVFETIDCDNDSRFDHLIDIDKDGAPDRYWDPDDDILSVVESIDVDYDETVEFVFDSDGDEELDKYFDPDDGTINPYVVFELNIIINGNGTVEKIPDGILFLNHTTVELKAIANESWMFSNWTGDLNSPYSKIFVMMDCDIDLSVNFVIDTNDYIKPLVNITKPKEKTLYKNDEEIRSLLFLTRIIGPISILVNASDEGSGLDKLEVYIDDELKTTINATDDSTLFNWTWDEQFFLPRFRNIKVIAYDKNGNNESDEVIVLKMGDYNFFRNHPKLSFLLAGVAGFFMLSKLGGGSDDEGADGEDDGSDGAMVDPVANAGGPYSGKQNEDIVFDGSDSYDPNEDKINYEWDFGDGRSGDGISPVHAYDSPGTYAVTLTVTDDKGNSGIVTTEVIISSSDDIEGESDGDEEDIFWYIVSALGAILLLSVGALYIGRKFYV